MRRCTGLRSRLSYFSITGGDAYRGRDALDALEIPGLGIELHFGWGLSYLSPKLTCPRNLPDGPWAWVRRNCEPATLTTQSKKAALRRTQLAMNREPLSDTRRSLLHNCPRKFLRGAAVAMRLPTSRSCDRKRQNSCSNSCSDGTGTLGKQRWQGSGPRFVWLGLRPIGRKRRPA